MRNIPWGGFPLCAKAQRRAFDILTGSRRRPPSAGRRLRAGQRRRSSYRCRRGRGALRSIGGGNGLNRRCTRCSSYALECGRACPGSYEGCDGGVGGPATRIWRGKCHRRWRRRFAECPRGCELHLAVGEVLCVRRGGRNSHRLQHAVRIHAAAAPNGLQGHGCQKERCKKDPVLGHGTPPNLHSHVQGAWCHDYNSKNPEASQELPTEVSHYKRSVIDS